MDQDTDDDTTVRLSLHDLEESMPDSMDPEFDPRTSMLSELEFDLQAQEPAVFAADIPLQNYDEESFQALKAEAESVPDPVVVQRPKDAEAVLEKLAESIDLSEGATMPVVLEATVENAPFQLEQAVEAQIDHAELGRLRSLVYKAVKHHTSIALLDDTSTTAQILDNELQAGKHDSAFYIVDLTSVIRKHLQWVTYLPRVRPFYAVKCNPDSILLRALHAMGTGFDCASRGELEAVSSIGVKPQDVIFANPCKNNKHIEYARDTDVRKMTFDNEMELLKIVEHFPDAELVLRIKPPVEQSLMSFSSKFGAPAREARRLVRLALEKGINLVGVSFHVGSGCYNPQAYVATLQRVRSIFDLAESLGKPMTLVDIGGGWPGSDHDTFGGHTLNFKDVADAIRPVLDDLFPPEVQIISEPGRYYVTQSATLAANIIARRANYAEEDDGTEADDDTSIVPCSYLYYISDGLYGSFNAILFDHMKPEMEVLHPRPIEKQSKAQQFNSTFFGPTCDSMDVVCRDLDLPELQVGDWLYFRNMGAYTMANGGTFNGFPIPQNRYVLTSVEAVA